MSDAPQLVSQPTKMPTRKTAQGAVAGGITVGAVTPFLIFGFNRIYDGNIPDDAYELLPYISAGAVWMIQSLRSYFAKELAS